MHTRSLLPLLFGLTAACAAAPSAPHAPAPSAAASTIDPRIQSIASEELDRIVAEIAPAYAVVVVVDAKTGAVLAMDGRDHGKRDATLPRAHAWVTGSTLKTMTVGAALDERTVVRDQRFACGKRAFGAEELHDVSECESIDVAGILAKSSNVGMSYVFDTLGSKRLTAWLKKLHVGDAPGSLPAIDDDKTLHAAMFPNGEVATATPLQMAAAYAAVFNDGVYAPSGERVFSHATADALTQMLEGAVTRDDGTGKAARVAGARVAGKTGTADVGEGTNYASFIGTVLDREPRFVALVGVEVPESRGTGPTLAAPAWQRIATRIVARP